MTDILSSAKAQVRVVLCELFIANAKELVQLTDEQHDRLSEKLIHLLEEEAIP